MRIRLFQVALLVLGVAVTAKAQTDVAASVYGAFNGTTNGNGVTQNPSNQAGMLAELHHQSNPLVGYELTYAWNRADQNFSAPAGCPAGAAPGTQCSVIQKFVPANAHEVTADYVVSLRVLNVRPFVLAGGGLLFNQPAGSQQGTQSQAKGVLVYGGGLDYALLPHLGLRGQYRGNLYKAPQLATAFSSTNAFTHTSEPMIGAYLRF